MTDGKSLKRFDYESEELTDDLRHSGQPIADPSADYAGELYGRVGEKFRVEWRSGHKAEPIIDIGSIDSDPEEIEVALTSMKDDGIL